MVDCEVTAIQICLEKKNVINMTMAAYKKSLINADL